MAIRKAWFSLRAEHTSHQPPDACQTLPSCATTAQHSSTILQSPLLPMCSMLRLRVTVTFGSADGYVVTVTVRGSLEPEPNHVSGTVTECQIRYYAQPNRSDALVDQPLALRASPGRSCRSALRLSPNRPPEPSRSSSSVDMGRLALLIEDGEVGLSLGFGEFGFSVLFSWPLLSLNQHAALNGFAVLIDVDLDASSLETTGPSFINPPSRRSS